MLHVAHALRGAESEADAAAVAALADELGVPVHARRTRRSRDGPDLERRARDLRRAAADELAAGRADRDRPHARRPHRDDPLPPRELAGRRGLPRAARRATAPVACGRCSSSGATRCARRSPPPASPGATTPRTTIAASRASARASICVPAFRSLHPAADQNLLRTAAQLVDQQAVLDDAAGALLSRTAPRSTRTPRRPRRPSSPAPRSAVSRGRRRRRPPASSARSSCATGARAPGGCRSARVGSPSAATAIVRVIADAPALAPPASAPLCVSGRTPFGSLAVSCRAGRRGPRPGARRGRARASCASGGASRRQARRRLPGCCSRRAFRSPCGPSTP